MLAGRPGVPHLYSATGLAERRLRANRGHWRVALARPEFSIGSGSHSGIRSIGNCLGS
jgi:hypothetical protein